MPRPTLLSQAFRDLADDIAFHAVNLAHGTLELVCLLALGLFVYAASIDPTNADLGSRPMDGAQANVEMTQGATVNSSHAPSSCSLTNDLLPADHRTCITAMVLDPVGI